MSKLKELVLIDGEEQLYQVEGNAFTDSPNPMMKLFMGVFRILFLIFGIKLKTYIVVTNKRIIRVDKHTILWGMIPKNTSVSTLNKKTIQSVGYAKAVRWLIFNTVYFRIESMTENVLITYKGSVEDVSKIVTEISKLVSE